MRVLTRNELDEVSGGFGPIGVAVGVVGGALASAATGGNGGAILRSAAIGGLVGLTGGMAGAASAGGLMIRTGWAMRSVGLSVAGSVHGNERGPKDSTSGK